MREIWNMCLYAYGNMLAPIGPRDDGAHGIFSRKWRHHYEKKGEYVLERQKELTPIATKSVSPRKKIRT